MMPHWKAYFNNPDAVWRGFITSIYLLGAFVGGFLSGPLSERIGRKRSIMVASVVFWFGTSMQTGASNVHVSCLTEIICDLGDFLGTDRVSKSF